MTPEFGHFALILALCVSFVQGVLPLMGAHCNHTALIGVARPAARVQFTLVLLSFVALTMAFVRKDFSVMYVASHSNSLLPLQYRITAVWGSHEGSLLLWGMMLSLWTMAVSFSRRLPDVFVARVLGILGLVSAGFLLFLLITSNPFERLLPAVPEGRDLNPLLQDPGMIIHPPLLYMGYVGFSVAFAFALAALISGQLDAAWARWSRPWTILAWVFLTLGITVGSGWAYYELGWGGWWFWDPVENASFMPWLVGTALVHSLSVTEKRGAFKSWTVLLAISAFSLSLLGTFLVRSGVLTSVHAFATDPRRGIFILALLVLVIGGSLTLFAWRSTKLSGGGLFSALSRETALLTNNVLLSVVCATVLLGTLYPLITEALSLSKISVGPPYFEAVFVPLMIPVVFLMVVAPFVRWKQQALSPLVKKLAPALLISVALGALCAWWSGNFSARMVLGLSLAVWVFVGSVQLLIERSGKWQLARLREIPLAWWGMWVAHVGIGVFIVGVTMVKGTESNLDANLAVGKSAQMAGYEFVLEGVDNTIQGPNYTATRATVALKKDGQLIKKLTPEKRFYVSQNPNGMQQMPMTEASLDLGLFRDIYASLGEQTETGTIVRLYYKPFISWLWLGCLLMTLGGVLAAADRRYRVKRKILNQNT